MENKHDIDNSAVPNKQESFTVDQENIEEPEKLDLVAKKTLESVEKVEDTTMVSDYMVDQPPPISDQLLSMSDNLMESTVLTQENLSEHTKDQIVPISQDNQEVIPDNDSTLNKDLKLEDNGVDIDQQTVLNMKDSELKDLVIRQLSEVLSDEPSQTAESSQLEINSELLKIDERTNNYLSDVQKDDNTYENDISDALSTLATAALNQAAPTPRTVSSVISKPTKPIVKAKHGEQAWCDVGIIKGTSCLVKQFHSASISDEHEDIRLDNLPDYTDKLKIDIQPNTVYKLRIAAVNSCGRGEWSEISSFRTCLPGYPGAPSAIKIAKLSDGVSLKWDAPPNSGNIVEYTVCMAVKQANKVPRQNPKPNSNFFRVYTGPNNTAKVSNESLKVALIDKSNKPAIIFRIAAKNDKGYGPVTQVRWLQESKINVSKSNKNPSIKREKSVNHLAKVSKKPKM